MIRPEGHVLLRSLRCNLPVRPVAMKSATSLLLGAALATAFFLLYTSLCRIDLGAGGPPRSPPPLWTQRKEKEEIAATARGAAAADDQEARPEQDDVAREEVERKEAVAKSDGGGGRDLGARTEEENQKQIVIPAAGSQQLEAEGGDILWCLAIQPSVLPEACFGSIGKDPAGPGRSAPASGDGGQDGADDGDQRGVGGAGVVPRPVPGELPSRRGHRAPAAAPAHRGHGRQGVREVQRRAPLLLLVPGGRHGLRRRAVVHEGRLPRDDVAEEQVPADNPRAGVQLPLHGRGHLVVPEPVPAPHPVGAGGDVVGLLRRRPQLPKQLPQRRPPLRPLQRQHRGILQALAGVAGAVPGEARAGRVRPDRQGRRAAARRHSGAVPRHRCLRRLLPARQGPGHRGHHARQLLRRPAEQAVRPQERARGLEDV
ncbi:uncharacterized protein LOC133892551 isoform X1 [Phragmites australis]|uniref:uncharacterized protein LOC133892551 isoform X1 n=1 Tax=Phragmites australis TaxID=29695 RepID=UPI002D772927|nr:uncharacterized protein LOC133892551 isoform X1 [Phragmites australis]